jgi:hypothetical protein
VVSPDDSAAFARGYNGKAPFSFEAEVEGKGTPKVSQSVAVDDRGWGASGAPRGLGGGGPRTDHPGGVRQLCDLREDLEHTTTGGRLSA